MDRFYIAIDLKSFYASVECVERGRDPMKTNLVVADASRTDKTICLAVSPALKVWGIPGRPRLFEVIQAVRGINAFRRSKAPGRQFSGKSDDADALAQNPALELDFIAAPPRMAKYMEFSTKIYEIYLKYVAPEDIHVYSVDEVFIDATPYLHTYRLTAEEFARKLVREVFDTTGITATAGIGTNLYLSKVAMDIVAKHTPADKFGARIASLDENRYRQQLWDHRPITDFWRVGRGYARQLEAHGLFTMGDVARCSLENEALLYKLFGVNAELLIDHAWGWEPCRIGDIKAYRPESQSMGAGQVLSCPYSFEKARIIVREMADALALDLAEKGLVTDQMVLTVGYDRESLLDPQIRKSYTGQITRDAYGREIPIHGHGSVNLGIWCASTRLITEKAVELYDRIANPNLLIRRVNLVANHITRAGEEPAPEQQLDLFSSQNDQEADYAALEREKRRQQAVLQIRRRYGKNAILKGMNFLDGATARERNRQIGGHKA